MNKLKTNSQSYLGPFIIMVVLMSLVGLITCINQQLQNPLQAAFLMKAGDLKNTLTTLIVFSFFLAYLVMGSAGAKMIDRIGYKGTLIRALIILIIGFLTFEASAFIFEKFEAGRFETIRQEMRVMTPEALADFKYTGPIDIPFAYYIFLLASFIAGTALTFMQAVVNPYLVACNVKGTSGVQRQTIAGAGNSSMTTIGPLLVAYIIFQGKSGLDIQIGSLYVPFFVLIALVAIIAVVLPKLHLPEIAGTTSGKDEKLPKSVWSFSHLTLGVIAIFFYVGVEVAVGANINLYAISLKGADGVALFTVPQAAQLAAFYWGGMLIGRLFGSFVSKISANAQLLFTSIGAGVLVVAAMVTGNPWLLVGVGLFHSIMWPAIFALAIDGLGRYTSKGSGALMMGVVGGAILPFVQGVLADVLGNWSWTWIIVIIGEIYLLYYALAGHKVKTRDDATIPVEP